MRAEIRQLQKRLGVTSLYVTHDQVEAMTLADRLIVMHEGRAAQIATPMAVFTRPATLYVAGFIGAPSMNFLPGQAIGDGAGIRLDAGPVIIFADGKRKTEDGQRLTLGVRPEHIALADDGMSLFVSLVEPLGSETLVHGRLHDGTALTLRIAGEAAETPGSGRHPAAGQELRIVIPPLPLHIFDTVNGGRIDPVSLS